MNKDLRLSENLYSPTIETASTREGYGIGVLTAGKQNKNVVVLSADLTDSIKNTQFKIEFPERFIQTGVAEQNMAGIAAGLALSGKIPYITSYASFNPGRNWDQIRVSICYSNANVKIIGAHAGLSVGPDGATHQALEDIAITRVLPNITVIYPVDMIEAKKATIAASKHYGPVYIRLAREVSPIITTEETPFEIGKAQIFLKGKDLTVIATGPITYQALKAANIINTKGFAKIEVISVSTIKPLDEKTIIDSAKKTGRVITVEEHQIIGGLGSAVTELLSEHYPVKIKRLGVSDSFGESGDTSKLYHKFGIDTHNLEVEFQNAL